MRPPLWETGEVAKRKRRRPREKAATVDYTDPEGNVLSLRQSLSPATIAKIAAVSGKAAASADDVWQRRGELLFEHLAVNWEIASLPLEDQKMLIGRFRMADAETRDWVRRTIAFHLETHIPELADR